MSAFPQGVVERTVGTARMTVLVDSIVGLDVDAIVNAANTSLLGGGGVDGAIHRAAGPELEFACRMLQGAKTGQAKITKGFRLKARYIIHAVGPVWRGGGHGEGELLAACYRSAMTIAAERGLKSIAFPAISTGIYKFPAEAAASIAVHTVAESLSALADPPNDIIYCCFDKDMAAHYQAALTHLP